MAPSDAKAHLSVIIPLVYNESRHEQNLATAARGSVVGKVQHMRIPFRVPSPCWHARSTPPSRIHRIKRMRPAYAPDISLGSLVLNLQKPISQVRKEPQFSQLMISMIDDRSRSDIDPGTREATATLGTASKDGANSSNRTTHSLPTDDGGSTDIAHTASIKSTEIADESRAMAHVLERVVRIPNMLGIHCLEVLLLRGNDIMEFSLLHACTRLKYIDLSYNRIRTMPPSSFFEGGPGPAHLRTLLLDHNFLGDWENLCNALEAARCLSILTIADNPIAKLGAYRSGVVNAAPALELLDCYPVADEELIEGADFTGTRFAAPARGRQARNTHWSSEPPLTLEFASIGRAIARLGGEGALVSHANLVTSVVHRLAASLSPCTIIQKKFRRWRQAKRSQIRKRFRLRVIAAALDLVGLDRLRRQIKQRDAARLIQSHARRYLVRSVAEQRLGMILLEKGEPRSLVEYVDAKDVPNSVVDSDTHC